MRCIGILLPVLLAFQAGVPPALAWTWPVGGPVLQYFTFGDDPYAGGQHRGIDVGAPDGATVVAPAAGTISFAGTVPGGGRTLTIETGDGYSVTLVHLGAVAVGRGATVEEGEAVGTIGPSGTAEVAEPYVHLGIRVTAEENGYVDPLGLLPPQATEQAVGDPAANVGGDVAAADPVEAVLPAVEPGATSGGDSQPADPPALSQPVQAAEPAAAGDGDSAPQVASPPATTEGASASQQGVGTENGLPASPAATPTPQPAAPAVPATPGSEPSASAGGTHPARSSHGARRAAVGNPAPRIPRALGAQAAPATPSPALVGRRATKPSQTGVAKRPAQRGAERRDGRLVADSRAPVPVAMPRDITAAPRPASGVAAPSQALAPARAVPRHDGGPSSWIVALAVAGALAAGAWLGRRLAVRPRPAAANPVEPTSTLAVSQLQPPAGDVPTDEVTEEDLRDLERGLELLLSTSRTPGQVENRPGELPPAREWAR